jgi:hypothetical protein
VAHAVDRLLHRQEADRRAQGGIQTNGIVADYDRVMARSGHRGVGMGKV